MDDVFLVARVGYEVMLPRTQFCRVQLFRVSVKLNLCSAFSLTG